MRTSEAPGRHLTADEVVDRVFPCDEDPAPIPLHLAACAECQERVAHLREGWLLDRGAVAGVVDLLPPTFWDTQTASIVALTTAAAPASLQPVPFSFHRSFLRRPTLAFGSLAAALALVAGITYSRLQTHPGPVVAKKSPMPVPTAVTASDEADRKDDELLRQIDDILADDGPVGRLMPEGIS